MNTQSDRRRSRRRDRLDHFRQRGDRQFGHDRTAGLDRAGRHCGGHHAMKEPAHSRRSSTQATAVSTRCRSTLPTSSTSSTIRTSR